MGLTGMSRIAHRWLLMLMVPMLPAGALAATANVTFVHPEKFTDIGRYGDPREGARNCAEIARHFEQLAARKLPSDETLQIEVLNVKLAGIPEPWRYGPYDLRVMHTGTWPSIQLRYRLTRGDQVLASGEETVSDMFYLDRTSTFSYAGGDHLRFEKRMLDDWFQDRLVEHKPAPG